MTGAVRAWEVQPRFRCGGTLMNDTAPNIAGDVIVALIAAAAALIGTIVTAIMTWKVAHRQKALEQFKAELQESLSSRQALTEYRFDARRRLYAECEPIFFQLREAAHDALRLIPRYCEAEFQQSLSAKPEDAAADDYWMLSDSSAIIYALYCLLRPMALYCLLKRKMTDVDLSLDPAALFRYQLARELYNCFCRDAEIAAAAPPVDYRPIIQDWRKLRATSPATHWWQGASPGRLENGVACLIDHDRVVSFGEFEQLYVGAYRAKSSANQKRLGVVANALYDFRPDDRPVFWRILIIKAHLYAALAKPVPEDINATMGSPDRLRAYLALPRELSERFDQVARSSQAIPPLVESAFGLDYLVERLTVST